MLKNMFRGTLALLTLALLVGGSANAAQKTKKANTGVVERGVISSIDATHMTMTHKMNGKDEPVTLVLTPETKKEGTLEAGSKVTVHYHMENNDRIATEVRAQTVTAKAKTPKATAKKKS